MNRIVMALTALLLFGVARLPFEQALTRDLHAAHFLQYQLNLDIRKQAGQMGFIAALSGYRAVVADYLWTTGYDVWVRTEWGRLKFLMDAVVALQPRAVIFWDNAAWQMAWNASVSALNNPNQPRETLRIKAQREYFRLGEQYLMDGIEYNPDRALLYETLGSFYKEKMNDHCRAAWALFEAAKRPDAHGYTHRAAVFELAKCPGHERETYDLLLHLYRADENERVPTLLKLLKEFQEKLDIPAEQRIDITEDLKAATPH